MSTLEDGKTSLETVIGKKCQTGNEVKGIVQCGQGDVCTGSENTSASLAVTSPDRKGLVAQHGPVLTVT